MPKTAQEWKDTLDLDALPDDEMLESLNALEGQDVVTASGEPGTFVEATPSQIVEMLLVEGVGQAFRKVRARAKLSVRQAGAVWRLSPGRISQIERKDANLQVQTIADLAARMGYRTRIVFEPVDGGEPIEATLNSSSSVQL